MTAMSAGSGHRARIERVFASGDPRLRRLAAAGTSVTIINRARHEESFTLLLDRNPPVAAGADEPAEITIELTATQFERYVNGSFHLPPALLSGDVPYRGPVRKYLTVDPVLRGLLAGADPLAM